MNINRLRQKLADRPFFESPELAALFDQSAAAVLPRLSRWVHQGKLIKLRRGRYLLPPQYQRRLAAPEYIANYLYRPSYVSMYSALQYYNLIPETVNLYQSITTRQTAFWDTPAGRFQYLSTGPERFFGYTPTRLGNTRQQTALMADPEKALIDVCYFTNGDWTSRRWSELRLQNCHLINRDKLLEYATRMNSRKIDIGIKQLINFTDRSK